MRHFAITVNGFQPLTIITKSSILDVAAVLDLPQLLDKNRNKIKTTLYSKMLFQKTKSAITANKIISFSCSGVLSDGVGTHFE